MFHRGSMIKFHELNKLSQWCHPRLDRLVHAPCAGMQWPDGRVGTDSWNLTICLILLWESKLERGFPA